MSAEQRVQERASLVHDLVSLLEPQASPRQNQENSKRTQDELEKDPIFYINPKNIRDEYHGSQHPLSLSTPTSLTTTKTKTKQSYRQILSPWPIQQTRITFLMLTTLFICHPTRCSQPSLSVSPSHPLPSSSSPNTQNTNPHLGPLLFHPTSHAISLKQPFIHP